MKADIAELSAHENCSPGWIRVAAKLATRRTAELTAKGDMELAKHCREQADWFQEKAGALAPAKAPAPSSAVTLPAKNAAVAPPAPLTILAQFEAILDPAARDLFYKAHKHALLTTN